MKIIFEAGLADEGKKFFNQYKEYFGEVIKAEIDCDKSIKKHKVTLFNVKNDELVFNKCISAGYGGEGPRATREILNLCGFDVDDEYVKNHNTFTFTK